MITLAEPPIMKVSMIDSVKGFMDPNIWGYIVIAVFIQYLWSRREKLHIFLVTLPRDIQVSIRVVSAVVHSMWMRVKNQPVFICLDKQVAAGPDRVCFYYEREKWTYKQVQILSFQVANYFQAQGYRKGDVVGIAMTGRPETVCIWLGLSRIGVISALMNYNARGDSLKHCVISAKCKAVIYGLELQDVFMEIRSSDVNDLSATQFYQFDRYLDGLFPINQKFSIPIDKSISSYDEKLTTLDLATCLKTSSSKPVIVVGKEKPNYMDCFLYIFTSGTTGLPKMAYNSHSRFIYMSAGNFLLPLDENDISYCPLPTYHTFALSSICWALVYGIPSVIVPKFSASRFWSDIHYYKPTVCLYMGELLRFLVNQPPQPELEKNHSLRKMYGVGVKPDVWQTFIDRFKIDRFVEVYGSTEGNCNMANVEGTKVGAMGYIPFFARPFYSITSIKVDEISGEILRNKETGLAIPCKEDEVGELVSKIVSFIPSFRFDGYTNKEATERKIARNVFRKGDKYFRTGDTVVVDKYGYIYFRDRIGDTYRWKGENVATVEVENVILQLCDMRSTAVYGVQVPGTEGRAGMAAILDTDKTLDLDKLATGFVNSLAFFAIPIFVRILQNKAEMDMTGTFKMQKFNFQKEGFNIEQISDPIYIFNSKIKKYEKLDSKIYDEILQGSYRL